MRINIALAIAAAMMATLPTAGKASPKAAEDAASAVEVSSKVVANPKPRVQIKPAKKKVVVKPTRKAAKLRRR